MENNEKGYVLAAAAPFRLFFSVFLCGDLEGPTGAGAGVKCRRS